MAELADAIVQSGRETLESAIRLVESHPAWRAQVVYGDTGAGGRVSSWSRESAGWNRGSAGMLPPAEQPACP